MWRTFYIGLSCTDRRRRIPLNRVEGHRYFQTLPLRASFFRSDKVEVGDFEEIDPFADLDDDDDAIEEM